MAVLENLEVNDNLELEIKSGPYQGTYPSKVADIDDEHIKILTPYSKGELIPVRKNLFLEVYYTDERAAYRFYTRVIQREREPLPALYLEQPSEVERIQRRDYFRLEVTEDIKYSRIDEEGQQLEDYQQTKMLDISGGGIKMKLNDTVPPEGTEIRILLDIEALQGIPVKGRIVQIYNLKNREKAAGVEFVDINPQLREAIVSWIFNKQREMRRKGLL